MRKLFLIVLALLLLPASAVAFRGVSDRHGDLDGDSANETVYTERVDLPGVDDEFDPGVIRIRDRCGAEVVDRRISTSHDGVAALRLRRVDTRRGAEVYLRHALGRLRPPGRVQGRGLAQALRHAVPPPPRAVQVPVHQAHPRAQRHHRRDLDLRGQARRACPPVPRQGSDPLETFLRRGEPECCGSVRKITYWRYSRARDKYLRYRTVVKRRMSSG